VVKCKYNIVRNGETKHLCDDDCFKTFRARPTSFLQSTRRAATAAECDYCHVAVGDVEITHTVGEVLKTFCQMVGAACTVTVMLLFEVDACMKGPLGNNIQSNG